MSYQKCPICDGTGQGPGNYYACTSVTCPTCRGYRIIHEVTGLPPEYAFENTETKKEPTIDDALSQTLQFLKK